MEISMVKETRSTSYIYGNAARKLQAEPARRIEREPSGTPHKRPKPHVKRRVDKVSVMFIVTTFAIALTVCYSYLRLQFQSTYMSKRVAALESEVLEMETENSNEWQALEENVDLNEIYKKATKELGMRSAKSDQIFTYESKKSTQVRLHNQ